MSIQLQQNLYSLYRIFLKIPRYVFLALLGLLLFVAVCQWVNMGTNNKVIDLSDCMFDYIIAQHNETYGLPINASTVQNATAESNKTSDEYVFIGNRTIINLVLGTSDQCSFQRNISYVFDWQTHPTMALVKTEQLSYLRKKSPQYLAKHGISYDKFILPKIDISTPLFAYFYNKQMHLNEILMQSLRQSILILDNKLTVYYIVNQINITKSPLNEAHITYYLSYPEEIKQFTNNLYSFVALRVLSVWWIKILIFFVVYASSWLMSIFVGLLIRYCIILAYTIFLIIYDKCTTDSWGWVHLYLTILWTRFRQKKAATLKMFILYVMSNVGMYAIFAFGSYCIIKKIIYTFFSFPNEDYTDFYFKIIFFVELFHFIFCRSRTTLRYFPPLAVLINCTTITLTTINGYNNVMMLLNINLTLQMILFVFFLLVEQHIQNQGAKGMSNEYCPSFNKPRMLFYGGYDVSWEKTLPPIWTYFTNWFDYNHFNEAQKSLIEKDYQLLYGRMLGMNDRQEIPDFDEQQEDSSEQIGVGNMPSNEMNLIRGDV